ncbi:6-phospho-beta-glucosidase [Dactylosporangium sp. NPDC049140]|uniref:6-phospho-beta-glucosidase n=1 Tax=Dactylosporangium sp. NPDC049140 TaxID=3155647 RepID=UPI0033DD4E61
MKIAVIGGGSTYTPELIDGVARMRDDLPVEQIVLVDPDTDRLAAVGGVSARIMAERGHTTEVSWTSDVDAAVDGATAVLLQLRVGGQAARRGDESWPQECGCIGQETTGAGGLAKALRTVPVVLDIARRVRERALDSAWIVDFTNPVGIVTRALLDEGHRAVGLCNVAIGFQRRFAKTLGVDPDRVSLDHIGLNHLTWERAVRLDGIDVLPKILADHGEELATDAGIPLDLMRRLGVVPSYYLRYFYRHDAVLKTQRTDPQTRAEKVTDLERELLSRYADPQWRYVPALLEQRGGAHYSDAALRLVASLVNDTREIQVVNVRNRGTLPFLPDEAVIEVPARVGADGAHAEPVEPVHHLYQGLIAHVAAYEELAVDAALHGGRERVFDALLAHPLVGQTDIADALTTRLLANNTDHLPWARAAS